MRKTFRLILACGLLVAAMVNPAIASVVYNVSEGIQPANVGTITLTQNDANSVIVSVDLLDGYGFLNTGGPHTPFAFNLTASAGVLSISPFSTPLNGVFADGTFSLNTSGGSNTPFGIFGVALDSSAGNGSSNAYFGDLLFTLSRTTGLTIADFVPNADGYYFSADLTDGKNTGAQAWKVSQVPIPAALPLFLTALAALSLMLRRGRATA
jgi:hypothetical protein